MEKTVPLQRWATVSEIADATIFLFSDAGRYINGMTIVVDGGGWRNGGNTVAPWLYPKIVMGGPEALGKDVYGKVKGQKGEKKDSKL